MLNQTTPPGTPEDLINGSRLYGPHASGERAQNDQALWYQPAHTLGNRTVVVEPGQVRIAIAANARRKFASIVNRSTVDTVYWGEADNVTAGDGEHGGFPIYPGGVISVAQNEYDGDIYVVTDSGAAVTSLRVMDPTADA